MATPSSDTAVAEMTTSRAGSKPALVPGKRTGRVMRSAERISPERARMMIQTGMLISELEAIGTGKKEAESHQVTALVALLRKTLPDLQATMISGDPNLPLTIITRAE